MAGKVKAEAEVVEAPVVPCTNCGGTAEYTLGDAVNVINFCPTCLPAHFVQDASAGLYPLVTP